LWRRIVYITFTFSFNAGRIRNRQDRSDTLYHLHHITEEVRKMMEVLLAFFIAAFAGPITLVLVPACIVGGEVLILGVVFIVVAMAAFAAIKEAAKALWETVQKVVSSIRAQAGDFLTACKYYYGTRHIAFKEPHHKAP
jgi:hypothetical protein